MAASRTCAPTAADIAARTASRRITFAKIAEPMQAPNLLALQTESFDWLVGNEKWRARVAAANAVRPGSQQWGRAARFEPVSALSGGCRGGR